MEIEHKEINFTDERGAIQDILDQEVDAVTFISYASEGVTRANHYHEHSVQWDYVLTGSLECFGRNGFDGEIEKVVIRAGDLVRHPIGEHHALRSLEPSTTLSLTKGPRRGKDYEQDVVRLEGEHKLV